MCGGTDGLVCITTATRSRTVGMVSASSTLTATIMIGMTTIGLSAALFATYLFLSSLPRRVF